MVNVQPDGRRRYFHRAREKFQRCQDVQKYPAAAQSERDKPFHRRADAAHSSGTNINDGHGSSSSFYFKLALFSGCAARARPAKKKKKKKSKGG